jgi:WS/DGAT/MGAT family acyltransferase
VWIEDPDFDLDFLVRRAALPAPGGPHELARLAGEIFSRQLDRTRPLWEMYIVEGLENGHIGTIAKMHHSTIDGVSGADLMVHLFDLEPDPQEDKELPELPEAEHVPSDIELLAHAAVSRARQPLRMARMLPGTIRSVASLVNRRRQPDTLGMPAPFSAPRTPFNVAITPHRACAFSSLSLDDIKAVKRAFGTTVNDVVLALCAGALRRYLDRKGELPDKPLVAVVPISVHGLRPEKPGTNHVSAMFTTLATDIDDPVERLQAIAAVTRGAKEDHNAIGADMLQDWAEFAAPTLFARAARLYSSMKLADRHRPIHNVIISNVPGPPFPLYFAGARLVAIYPMGPVMEGAGLNITVLSYIDKVDVGLMVCHEALPDVWDLADAFPEAMDELKKAAAAAS